MAPVGREDLVTWLRAVDRGNSSVEAMRRWMDAIFIGDSVELSEHDADLVMTVVYQLDFTTADAEFLTTARTVLAVLTNVKPDENARALLLLTWERDRLVDILDKRIAGVVGQTDFEAFLGRRRWPPEVIQRIVAMDASGRARLLKALRAENYFSVAGIFFGAAEASPTEASESQEGETRRLVDRREVERVLDAVATGDLSHDQLLAWAATVLAGEEYYIGETEDNDLIWHVVYGVEECSDPGREGEIVACAARYRKALLATKEPHAGDALLWLAGDQNRVLDQLTAYLAGEVSREEYIAAIEERAPAWPPELIGAMLGLSEGDMRSLAEALERDDYQEVLRILQL
jgi:hypothetical protein